MTDFRMPSALKDVPNYVSNNTSDGQARCMWPCQHYAHTSVNCLGVLKCPIGYARFGRGREVVE